MALIAINDVLRYEGRLVRVIAAMPSSDHVIVVELPTPDSKSQRKLRRTMPYRLALTDVQRYAVAEADPFIEAPLVPRQTDVRVMETRYDRIKDIADNPAILFNDTRGALLRKHAKVKGVTTKTLLADLRLWWNGGQVKLALLGTYYRCGRVTSSTKDVQTFIKRGERGDVVVHMAAAQQRRAPGRRPADKSYEPYAISSQERLDILATAEAYFKDNPAASLIGAAREVLRRQYLIREDNAATPLKGGRVSLPPGKVPNHRQIIRLLRRVIPPSREHITQYGIPDFVNNHAPELGTVRDDCIGPADVYEVDDTNFDVWPVAAADIRAVYTKPTLHVVIDRYSWLIVGFYLSLDPPSYEDNKMAMLSVCNDWKALCEDHGVEYVPDAWPAERIVPNRIFADRAGLMTFASDGLKRLDQEVTNPPSMFSKSKAVVEGTFRRISQYVREWPGYEPSRNVHTRRRKKYEANACLNMKLLYGQVLQMVSTLNVQALAEQQQSVSDTLAGTVPTPSNLFTRDIGRLYALPKRVSPEWMRYQLMEVSRATVTRFGIEFQKSFYASEAVHAKDWFSVASLRGPFEVTIRHFPKNRDQLIVEDPSDPDQRYVVALTSRSNRTEAMSLVERQAYEKARRDIRREAQHMNEEYRVGTLELAARQWREPYADMREATQGIPLQTRLNAGQALREQEAEANRQRDFRLPNNLGLDGKAAEHPSQSPPPASGRQPRARDEKAMPPDRERDQSAIDKFLADEEDGA